MYLFAKTIYPIYIKSIYIYACTDHDHDGKMRAIKISWILVCWAHLFSNQAVNGKQRAWLGPSQFLQGVPPFERDSFGFTSVEEKLFVYGGIGDSIGELHNLHRKK